MRLSVLSCILYESPLCRAHIIELFGSGWHVFVIFRPFPFPFPFCCLSYCSRNSSNSFLPQSGQRGCCFAHTQLLLPLQEGNALAQTINPHFSASIQSTQQACGMWYDAIPKVIFLLKCHEWFCFCDLLYRLAAWANHKLHTAAAGHFTCVTTGVGICTFAGARHIGFAAQTIFESVSAYRKWYMFWEKRNSQAPISCILLMSVYSHSWQHPLQDPQRSSMQRWHSESSPSIQSPHKDQFPQSAQVCICSTAQFPKVMQCSTIQYNTIQSIQYRNHGETWLRVSPIFFFLYCTNLRLTAATHVTAFTGILIKARVAICAF